MQTAAATSASPPTWQDVLLGIPYASRDVWQRLPLLKRWLIASRASVLPLTLFAVLFSICLNPPRSAAQALIMLIATLALLLAHATNNLLNDYVDFKRGLDQGNYARARYGVHVLADHLMSAGELRRYIYVTGGSAAVLAILVLSFSPVAAAYFALAGAGLVLFYTYPLKAFGLGEVAVFAAWGPLMVGGMALLAGSSITADLLWVGALYGLGPTMVICAKHTDKLEDDCARGVVTVPALLGQTGARRLLTAIPLAQLCGAVALALVWGYWGMLAIVASTPLLLRLLKLYRQSPPATCPPGFPATAWPLWFTTHSFVYVRAGSLLLIVGVAVQQLL